MHVTPLGKKPRRCWQTVFRPSHIFYNPPLRPSEGEMGKGKGREEREPNRWTGGDREEGGVATTVGLLIPRVLCTATNNKNETVLEKPVITCLLYFALGKFLTPF